jgi:hypothetical protein
MKAAKSMIQEGRKKLKLFHFLCSLILTSFPVLSTHATSGTLCSEALY